VTRLVAIALVAACCPRPAVPPEIPPVRIERVNRACLDAPPPPEPRIDFTSTGECDACFDAGQKKGLLLYLMELHGYAAQAWTLCGTEPKETP
jgi:hypothetical protein